VLEDPYFVGADKVGWSLTKQQRQIRKMIVEFLKP